MVAGATQVVLIGSDSPTLPVNLVEQAFSELDKNDAVLGPARDGGYYLIGLKQIWLGLLQGVRRSTPHCARRHAAAAAALCRVPDRHVAGVDHIDWGRPAAVRTEFADPG